MQPKLTVQERLKDLRVVDFKSFVIVLVRRFLLGLTVVHALTVSSLCLFIHMVCHILNRGFHIVSDG